MGDRSGGTGEGPRLRTALTGIPTYKPGRPAAAAAVGQAYKISSNENPYPPLPSVVEVLKAATSGVNRYPHVGAADLCAKIAERFDVPIEHVVTGTGSVGVAQQVVQATSEPGSEVIYAWRSFEAYPIVTQISGATSVQVPLRPDETHDLDAMADAVTDRTRLIFVCSPNNPTSTVVHRAEMERFLDRVPGDVLVVIDEAYREFIRDADVPDGIELYRERPNVAVLRTFSKAYGLAGLRVGFAVAHDPVAVALRACAVPFGVNILAQTAAIASLAAEEELLDRVEKLVGERSRLREGLLDAGFVVVPTEANFVWLRLGERTGEFAAACEVAGVTVRPFEGEGVRITVGEPEATDTLLRVASAWQK